MHLALFGRSCIYRNTAISALIRADQGLGVPGSRATRARLTGNVPFLVGYRLQLPLLTKIQRYPPDNEEKQKKLGAWFGANPPGSVAERLPGLAKALDAKYPKVKSWGVLGVCCLVILRLGEEMAANSNNSSAGVV